MGEIYRELQKTAAVGGEGEEAARREEKNVSGRAVKIVTSKTKQKLNKSHLGKPDSQTGRQAIRPSCFPSSPSFSIPGFVELSETK